MTFNQILTLALANTHTKTSQVGATNLATFFNLVYRDLVSTVVKDVGENYFLEIWQLDAQDETIAKRANGEYTFPVASDSQKGMLKMLRLAVKPTSDDVYHVPAKEVDIKTLDFDWSYYMENQPKSNPIYFVGDNSFFLAPKFAAADLPAVPAGNKQLKLYGIASATDLAADAAEITILLPADQHPRIAQGMEQYIYKSRGKKKEAGDALSEYQFSKSQMIDDLTNRDDSKMAASLPADTDLQYAD